MQGVAKENVALQLGVSWVPVSLRASTGSLTCSTEGVVFAGSECSAVAAKDERSLAPKGASKRESPFMLSAYLL